MKPAGITILTLGALALGACALPPDPQKVSLLATSMRYTPSTLEVTAVVPVDLTLVNEDALEHDFSILEIPVMSVGEADTMSAEHQMEMGDAATEPMLHVAAEPGDANSLALTPAQPGE